MTRKLVIGIPVLFALVMMLGISCSSAPNLDAATVRAYADPIAENMLQAITQNDYPKFSQSFNQQMKDALTQKSFEELYNTVQSKIGAYQTKEFSSIKSQSGYVVVIYNAKYANEPANVTITVSFQTVNGKNLVGGFYLSSPKLAAH